MAAKPIEQYVSHTEPEALIPNRIDWERTKALAVADLHGLARLLAWRTRLEYGESPRIIGIE